MRTLALLAALLLLAVLAQAGTLQETADQVPAQDQPGVKDQDLLGHEDQDVAVSFTREERFIGNLLPQLKLPPYMTKAKWEKVKEVLKWILRRIPLKIPVESCRCRPQEQCPYSKVNNMLDRASWVCRPFSHQYKLCCK